MLKNFIEDMKMDAICITTWKNYNSYNYTWKWFKLSEYLYEL